MQLLVAFVAGNLLDMNLDENQGGHEICHAFSMKLSPSVINKIVDMKDPRPTTVAEVVIVSQRKGSKKLQTELTKTQQLQNKINQFKIQYKINI